MAKRPYNWKNGPAIVEPHTIAKHDVIRNYLIKYFQTLSSIPQADGLKITLVDGFAGGGEYIHSETKELLPGSPLICLQAVQESRFRVNQNRAKPFDIDASYFFVEKNNDAFNHLKYILEREGYSKKFDQKIFLYKDKFQNRINDIIAHIKTKSPKTGRSIFILDQYGYKEISSEIIKTILRSCPGAEIILTFHVDSWLNYSPKEDTFDAYIKDIEENIGVKFPKTILGKTKQDIIDSEGNWRPYLQKLLNDSLIEACEAKFYTPFFIKNHEGQGMYWLAHLSQHPRARDVMVNLHWEFHNHFQHYGGSGINMLGFDPRYSNCYKNQYRLLSYNFDEEAHISTIESLTSQLPQVIFDNTREGTLFKRLYEVTCNSCPANSDQYKESLGQLIEHKEIEVISKSGVVRKKGNSINNDDLIRPAKQGSLFSFIKY